MTPATALLSRPLELINAAGRALFEAGLAQVHRAGVPVISVGNIALGGTGKSPLVASLARTLLAHRCRVAVLTRGYGRREREPVLAWRDAGISWERIGDEPAALARALPEVAIVADPDRVRGAARAIAATGATHLLLDDGFQHWRLAREIDLVVVDAADPLCRRRPRREHPRTLARASAIVVNAASATQAEIATALLAQRLPGMALLAVTAQPRALHLDGQVLQPSALAGRPVVAMAGIASPGRFFAALTRLGADVVRQTAFPDHHVYSPADLGRERQAAARAGALLVTTAKDAVKLPAPLAAGVAWLEIELVPLAGSFESLLATVLASPPP